MKVGIVLMVNLVVVAVVNRIVVVNVFFGTTSSNHVVL